MKFSIIPKPRKFSIQSTDKHFILRDKTTVNAGGNYNALNDFNAFLNKAFGYTLKENNKGSIIFKIDKSLEENLGKEGYLLEITEKKIEISASYENGIFYGIQSLKQLTVQSMDVESASLPLVVIEDKPLYTHRGYMLDVCRHFFTTHDLIKIIDTLALQKINVFHWHLTEDQGWRIEIDAYPRLTTVGARRDDTIGDKKFHGGYYSKEDIKKVVDYCTSKFITVIPEIDLPGHSMAAAAAYDYLTCRGEKLKVATTFGIKPDIFCAGKASTYEFLFKVLDEIVEMFPGEFIHLGGDEAPKSRWNECPECQKAIKENNLGSVEQLQGFFLNKLVDYLKKKGKKVICWNESIYSKILDPSVVCQYWSDGKVPQNVINEMNIGRAGIISRFTPYYLDYPFAMHSVKKLYNYKPELEGLNADAKIMGIEAPLWTEYVKNLPRIEYMTYPRLTALGEIAWTRKEDRNYGNFMESLPGFLKLLEIYRVEYAPLKDINPGLFKSIKQMYRFIRTAFFKENVKSMKESAKNAKSIKEVREEK